MADSKDIHFSLLSAKAIPLLYNFSFLFFGKIFKLICHFQYAIIALVMFHDLPKCPVRILPPRSTQHTKE